METNVAPAETSLRITRHVAAPRASVFRALTEPHLLRHWFAPTDDFEAFVDVFDAKEGEDYRIEMRHAGGNVHTVIGTIREVVPPERLVYTWRWEGGEMGDTLVTFELNEIEDGTELVLTHEQFPNAEATAAHLHGWNGCIFRLNRLLVDRPGDHLAQILDVNERLFRNALEGVSDADFTRRVVDQANPMVWVAGHIAHVRDLFADALGAGGTPNPQMTVFGTSYDPNASYPSRKAILDAMEGASKRLRERLAVVTPADLATPAPGAYPVADQTLAGGTAFLTQHESYHVGQLGFLRRAAGYAAVAY